ncbi:MAG TPA: SsrA-binding protein SmpB [Anaerolineales bacterium]|jgi:SsrA-binding protein|nr:SsrA-binding protein SmpB [Anaerolineales bacterium]
MSEEKILASNRKATHDYFIEDRFEAGVALLGSEIKSIRAGRVQLREAYVRVDGSEVWLINAHVSVYDPAARQNHDPLRPRKLLLHRTEIRKLIEKVKLKGYTIVPLDIHLSSKGRAKVTIALAKGKRQYDKRQTIAQRDSERDMARALGQKERR